MRARPGCAEHCRNPEQDLRAWAEQEMASKYNHQVGASCPGVTQCIPPFVGILLPLLKQGADPMPTVFPTQPPLGLQSPIQHHGLHSLLQHRSTKKKRKELLRLEKLSVRLQVGLRAPNWGMRDVASPTALMQTEAAFKSLVS